MLDTAFPACLFFARDSWFLPQASSRLTRRSQHREVQIAQAFKVGDVVQLNSGRPKMTVANVQADGNVRCAWFSPDGS